VEKKSFSCCSSGTPPTHLHPYTHLHPHIGPSPRLKSSSFAERTPQDLRPLVRTKNGWRYYTSPGLALFKQAMATLLNPLQSYLQVRFLKKSIIALAHNSQNAYHLLVSNKQSEQFGNIKTFSNCPTFVIEVESEEKKKFYVLTLM